ncbi:MAG TPA: RAMP superfamily CRISPR-associated protein [Thermoanaerobaculia bacterium]|nr:RAMP superfamily CRISPR-associated protein [Thermoanaerobaculia bacterium]
MFNTWQNSALLSFRLVPDGPILVRAQQVGVDPGAADILFHRTRHQGRSTVFLAGSGLKGVLRAHCEQLLRSADHFCCDPTRLKDDDACSATSKQANEHREKEEERGNYPHARQCPACFTFGSTRVAGRFHFDDAFPAEKLWEETNRTEVRAGVGIDRKSQGPAEGVLYDTEVVVGGGFEVKLRGENFCLWQLGLVLQGIADLGLGLVRVGGCKSRGMGAMKVEKPSLTLRFLDRDNGQLNGIRRQGKLRLNYGLPGTDRLAIGPGQEDCEGLFRRVVYDGEAFEEISRSLATGPLDGYLKGKA